VSIIAAVRSASAGSRAFAWGGAAAFAVSLAYFLFSYAVTFGETSTGPFSLRAVLVDAALFAVFAVHHSAFARPPVRAWMGRHVSPRLERAVYVWAASLMLIAVCALWQPLPGVAWRASAPWSWLLHAGAAAGVWLTLRSAAMIDVWELAGVKQVADSEPGVSLPPGSTPPGRFRTDGPYGWVRHPIYLGWLLIVFGVATMTSTRLAFAAISTLYIVVAIPLEERTLVQVSGGAYRGYMALVRRRLIPGVY
jgi:protein-S-isoprenylcysteine O-methyltransferase Ste14